MFPPNPRLVLVLNSKRVSDKPALARGNSRSPFMDDSTGTALFPRTDSYNSTTTEKTKSRSNTVLSATGRHKGGEDAPAASSLTGGIAGAGINGTSALAVPPIREATGRRESVSVFSLSMGGLSSAEHATVASELVKRQQFMSYLSMNYRTMESHCQLVLEGFNKPTHSGSHPASNTHTHTHRPVGMQQIVSILGADLNLEDCLDLLDECADMVLEASMQHYTLTLATGNTAKTADQALVVKEFREYTGGSGRRDGDMLGGHYSRSTSGSKYSYFNKELRRLSTNDKKGSHMSASKPPTPKPGGAGGGGLTATSTATSLTGPGDGTESGSGSYTGDSSSLGISYQSYGSKMPKPGSHNVSAGSSYVRPSSLLK